MLTQAELWELRPQGSNPCRNVRRYKMKPRERFLSVDELNLLGFVLDHAEESSGRRVTWARAANRSPHSADVHNLCRLALSRRG